MQKREKSNKWLKKQGLKNKKKNGLIILVLVVLVVAILIINRELLRRKKAKLLHQSEIELQREHEQRLQEELLSKNVSLPARFFRSLKRMEYRKA